MASGRPDSSVVDVAQRKVMGGGSERFVVDEVADQPLGRRIVDVRRLNPGDVAVLGELCYLELFVVATRVIMRIGTGHSESHRARCRALHGS